MYRRQNLPSKKKQLGFIGIKRQLLTFGQRPFTFRDVLRAGVAGGVYDWVHPDTLLKRRNLLLATATMGTQNVTTSATPYTLSFTGTGTVTLSGTSTAGPLVGAGSLTFTPTAGTLTLTVSGSVLTAQLEKGSSATSYQVVTDWNTEYIAACLQQITLWKDNTFTTPVTALEDVVGGVIDFRYGGARGANVVVNGGFDADTNWTHTTTGAGTATITGGKLTLTSPGADAANVRQVILTAGSLYEIAGEVTVRSGSVKVDLGGTSTFELTSSKSFKVRLFAASTTLYLSRWAACDADFDNISVREIPGAHLIQPTAVSRMKVSARYNLLLSSENLAASWTLAECTQTAGTITGSANAGVLRRIYQAITVGQSPAKTVFRVKAGTQRYVQIYLVNDSTPCINFDLQTGTLATIGGSGGAIADAGDGYYDCSLTYTAGGPTAATGYLGFIDSMAATRAATHTATGTTLLFSRADVRYSADTSLPAYQRVNTATDYDAEGFPVYLKPDGADDFIYSASTIDFSGTDKLTYIGGVSKLSDAAVGIVCELTADLNSNNGSFYVAAPSANGTGNFEFKSKGTTGVAATAPNSYSAPQTKVLAGSLSISAPSVSLRMNGVATASSASTQGTGNLANATLYVGARAGTSVFFGGRIFPFAIVGEDIGLTKIAKSERWLAANRMRGLISL